MSAKKHILVVEDVPFIFNEVQEVLEDAGFSVDKFTPSVERAILRIKAKRPDLVLLDIQLKGEHNGIYLGYKLRNEYYIPYIYVTDNDDDYTFNKSAEHRPEAFISKKALQLKIQEDDVVVKTKPNFNEKQLLQQMILTLQRNEDSTPTEQREGVMAFVEIPKHLSNAGMNKVAQKRINYQDIELITTKIVDDTTDTIAVERLNQLKKEGKNIAKIITEDGNSYYYRKSLTNMYKALPYNFVFINQSEIVNLTAPAFDGRINGRRLKLSDRVFAISDVYKKEVEKRISHFYQ